MKPLIPCLILCLAAAFPLKTAAQDTSSPRTKALLESINQQYQRDLEEASKKHIADVIMGNRWGEMNPKDDLRFQLVRVYVEQKKYPKALAVLNNIIEQSPDSKAQMRAWCTRGAIAEIGLNKPKDALKEYRKAIQTKGNQYVNITGGAYLAMAEIYLKLGDRHRAKLILEESYKSLGYTFVKPVVPHEQLMETES